ncbi:MAG: redoxin domain-containing protein [Bacteroidales bacterium]|nr:redoxin domain-containing protein [Bacteroidales bacterium]
MKKTILAIICLLMMSSAVSFGQTKNNPKVGDMFIDFTVQQDPENPNSKVSLSNYVGRGKWVVADFWASWCHWCIKEIPTLKRIFNDFPKEKVTVLSIAVWDKLSDTKLSAKQNGVVWSQIVNTGDIASDAYGFGGIPYIVVFDPQGKIAAINLRGDKLYGFVKESVEK